jgi:hypothetical protein
VRQDLIAKKIVAQNAVEKWSRMRLKNWNRVLLKKIVAQNGVEEN